MTNREWNAYQDKRIGFGDYRRMPDNDEEYAPSKISYEQKADLLFSSNKSEAYKYILDPNQHES